MESGKTREQLLQELLRMQKDIEERVEAQERFIRRFQMLIQNDGLFSQVLHNLPLPVAIFDRDGVLCTANNALTQEAGIAPGDITSGKLSFLDRVTDENDTVLDAVEDVFTGKTIVLRRLRSPLAMFCRDDSRAVSDAYQSAVFFPVTGSDGSVALGAVVLMK